jgi:hypothetical protein
MIIHNFHYCSRSSLLNAVLLLSILCHDECDPLNMLDRNIASSIPIVKSQRKAMFCVCVFVCGDAIKMSIAPSNLQRSGTRTG